MEQPDNITTALMGILWARIDIERAIGYQVNPIALFATDSYLWKEVCNIEGVTDEQREDARERVWVEWRDDESWRRTIRA